MIMSSRSKESLQLAMTLNLMNAPPLYILIIVQMKTIFSIHIKKSGTDLIKFSWENLKEIRAEMKDRYNFYKIKPEACDEDFFWLVYTQSFKKSWYNFDSYIWGDITNISVWRDKNLKDLILILSGEEKSDKIF